MGFVSAKRTGNIKLALCTIAFREKLLDYVLSVADELGVAGVEIWGREPHISEKFDENRVRTARRMVARRGLNIPVFGSYLRFASAYPHADDTVELGPTLHTARCLRAPIVRVWASDVGSAEATEAIWTTAICQIRQACEQAAKLSIILAAEMHDVTLTDTGAAARRLVEEVNRPNFRLNFQISTYINTETPEQRLAAVLPYVVHVHAQNYQRLLTSDGDGLIRASLEQGVIDYASLVRQLVKAGYDGYIAVEFAPLEGRDKSDALRCDIEYLQSLL